MKKTALLCALVMGTSMTPAYAGSGPIKVVLAEEADLLEPCMATRSNIGRIIMANVSETLTELDVRGGTGVQPRLAEKWEQNADGSWRFHLRQGVTFSDGTGFDAKDVKHSFDRIMSEKNTCESRRYFGGITVTPTVVDDYTIDFNADPVQPILPLLIRQAITSEVLLGQANVGFALALEMIVVVTLVMVAYNLLLRRASRWMR